MTQALVVGVRGVGVLGPGMPDWAGAQPLLREPSRWISAPTALAGSARLPPAERRRTGTIVKLSLAVADQAIAQGTIDPRTLATVFSASTGDTDNCHALCEALALPQRAISPTRFTNSVHNAAAGYWHIATKSRAPSTSLCGFDASFGAGLLEAAVQCVASRRPVLLVAGDVPYPEPLHATRPLPDAFGVALLLDPQPGPLHISVRIAPGPITTCDNLGLDALRRAVPAARALPLLQALARGGNCSLMIDMLDGCSLAVQVAA
jgi:Beta-ketoacyl synthase, N-terminal domain